MIDAAVIANRHSLHADGLVDETPRHDRTIRIIMSDTWARSRAGQLLASCLVNLLCRQIGLVGRIEIVAAQGPFLIRQPNGKALPQFPDDLGTIIRWAVNDAVAFSPVRTSGPADHAIMIGGATGAADEHTLLVMGTGWRAWIGKPVNAPRGVQPEHRNPLGPFLAAALAAGEIFKSVRGILRGRMLTQEAYSLWSGEAGPDWTSLPDGPEIAGGHLKPFHLFGAGAVGNDLAYILMNMELADAYAAVIDDDSYDGTSLNRCLLAGWQDVGHPKVDVVSLALREAGIGVFSFPGTIKQYLVGDRTTLRSDLAHQVDNLAFDVVTSCVDRGGSRQDIQGLAPATLAGGSTLGLAARANYYPVRCGAACLACFNPAERDGEKIRAMERQLRSMNAVERSAFLAEQGVDPRAVEEWLASPRCGTLGEAAVRELATRVPSQFSVSFVSLGAALLLASMLLRLTMFPGANADRGDMNAFNFLNGRVMDSYLAPDEACEWGCQSRHSRAA